MKQVATISFLKSALFVLAAPLLEFLFLRVFLRDILGIHIGYHGLTDHDLLFPGVAGFFLLFYLLTKADTPRLKLRWPVLGVNLTAILMFLLLNHFFHHRAYPHEALFASAWMLLVALVLLSSFFLFLRPSFYFKNPNRVALLPSLYIASSNIISKGVFDSLWWPLANITGRSSCVLAKGLFPATQCGFDGFTKLTHPDYYCVVIGRGCSGMEGMFFFISTLVLVASLDIKRLPPTKWALLAVLGILYMYFLNLLRIIGIYSIGIWFSKLFRFPAVISKTAMVVSHNGMSWVIYALGLFLFYKLAFRNFKVSENSQVLSTQRYVSES